MFCTRVYLKGSMPRKSIKPVSPWISLLTSLNLEPRFGSGKVDGVSELKGKRDPGYQSYVNTSLKNLREEHAFEQIHA